MRHTVSIAYHITQKENLLSIIKEGLIPQIGKRFLLADEHIKYVYLFTSIEDAEEALLNWLGEAFFDIQELILLEINLHSYTYISSYICPWEIMTEDIILPNNITIIKYL